MDNNDDSNKFDFGLPENASTQEMQEFADYSLQLYRTKRWEGKTLAEYFADDFEPFTENDYKGLKKVTRRDLRDFLREHGVFVPKGIGVQIPGALLRACCNHPPWPPDDPDTPKFEERAEEGPSVALSQSTTQEPGPRAALATSTLSKEAPLAKTADAQPGDFARTEGVQIRSEDTTAAPIMTMPISTVPKVQRFGGASMATGGMPHSSSNRSTGSQSGIVSLLKAYTYDSDKYSGNYGDNFEYKLKIYNNRCDMMGVDLMDRSIAIPAMLTRPALNFYFDFVLGKVSTYPEIIQKLRERFITPESIRALVSEFENITLQSVMHSNSGKTITDCLNIMVARLQELQMCLPQEYRSELILRNRLLNAARNVEACKLAIQKPALTVQGVIADLQSSVQTIANPLPTLNSNAMLIDRNMRTKKSNLKRCYVCHKLGCFSTKHPYAERLKALKSNKKRFRALVTAVDNLESEDENNDTIETLDDFLVDMLHLENEDDYANDDDRGTTIEPLETPPHEASNTTAISPDANLVNFTMFMQDCAASYSLSATVLSPRRYDAGLFYGVMIDTGCAHASTCGSLQYLAYCSHVGTSPKINRSTVGRCKFGMGSADSKGVARISFPMNGTILSFNVHVVDADVPLLLSLADMDALKLHYNNLNDTLNHRDTRTHVSITRVFGHPFYIWHPLLESLYTEVELQRLHRRFGHPHTDKLMNFLKRVELNKINSSTRAMLQNIAKRCQACQIYSYKPRRFKFTLRDDRDFNHTIYIDIFYIDGKPILHVVDEATRYQAARWLESASAESVWASLRLCWIDVYLEYLHIRTKTIPVEAAQSLSIVERYHMPVKKAYRRIMFEAPRIDKVAALQMAVKAVNDSVGPDGLVPTLLVYGALPRLGFPSDPPAQSTRNRAQALKKATQEMSRYFASRQYKDAMKSRSGPVVTAVHNLPLGSPVLVYRPKLDKYDGPFKLLSLDGETMTVLTPRGLSQFRTTVCKPFYEEQAKPGTAQPIVSSHVCVFNSSHTATPSFAASRQKECLGLLENGVFDFVPASNAKGHRVFRSRFVDEVRLAGTSDEFTKSRLVVQAFNDKRHGYLTYAPTVQRSSQRSLLSAACSFPYFQVFTRDISQAYTQSDTLVQRDIFVVPPAEFGVDGATLLKVKKPLYGLPEAGVHWFGTYHRHHIQSLKMKDSAHDKCLMWTSKGTFAHGIVCLQVDDSLVAGDSQFIKMEHKMALKFKSKPPVKIDTNAVSKTDFISQRARGAYFAAVCRPDLSYKFTTAAQCINPTAKDAKLLNKAIEAALQSRHMGLRFVSLDVSTAYIAVFVDASFASNRDYSSQLGFLIALVDSNGFANIIHYASVKSKRVTRSVLAAELYAMVHGYDSAATLQLSLSAIFRRRLAVRIYTDSRSLYDSVTRLSSTREKRLLIDLSLLREAFEKREISDVFWIPGNQNPADAFTKQSPCAALTRLLQTNKIDINPNAWVERPSPSWMK
eukprot:IDg4960t1